MALVWTSLPGRCIGLGLFVAVLPTVMRMQARPDPRLLALLHPGEGTADAALTDKERKAREKELKKKAREGNPWKPIGWTKQEWFWAVDFTLGAWVALLRGDRG
jgi:hypothetical protein